MAWKQEVLGRLCDGERMQIVYPTQREAKYDFDEFCDWLSVQIACSNVSFRERCTFHGANGDLFVRYEDGVVFFDSVAMAHRRCGM